MEEELKVIRQKIAERVIAATNEWSNNGLTPTYSKKGEACRSIIDSMGSINGQDKRCLESLMSILINENIVTQQTFQHGVFRTGVAITAMDSGNGLMSGEAGIVMSKDDGDNSIKAIDCKGIYTDWIFLPQIRPSTPSEILKFVKTMTIKSLLRLLELSDDEDDTWKKIAGISRNIVTGSVVPGFSTTAPSSKKVGG